MVASAEGEDPTARLSEEASRNFAEKLMPKHRRSVAKHPKSRPPSPSKIYTANKDKTSLPRPEFMALYRDRHNAAKAEFDRYRAKEQVALVSDINAEVGAVRAMEGPNPWKWSPKTNKRIGRHRRKRYEQYGLRVHMARERFRKSETDIAYQIIAEHPK